MIQVEIAAKVILVRSGNEVLLKCFVSFRINLLELFLLIIAGKNVIEEALEHTTALKRGLRREVEVNVHT